MTEPVRGSAHRVLNQVVVFNYVTTPKAPTYRAILEVFFAAKQRFAIDIRPAEILEGLRHLPYVTEVADERDLESSLDQLVEWGNLFRSHDSAAVTRIDDFYRKRFVYHLSGAGEAAHRAVRDVEAVVGKQGELQAGMLGRIRDALLALVEEAGRSPPHSEKLAKHFWEIFTAFDSLTEQATRFIGEVNRRLEGSSEVERFSMMKEALLAYISRFVEQLRILDGQIADGVRQTEKAGVQSLVEVASQTADISPGFGEGNPRQDWIAEQLEKWDGVIRWFVGSPGHSSPIAESLARAAVNAVVGLTRALARLNDRQSGRAGRKAEFFELARGFAACPDSNAAHDLWRDSIGLYSTRHFHLEEVDPELGSPSASWWDACPVDVPIRLRSRGQISRAGRASPVPDRSEQKRWMAERRLRERLLLEAARRRFSDRGEMHLGDLARLDAAEFDLLLELLDEALTAPRDSEGARRTRTRDGCLEVILTEPREGGGAAFVEIETSRGRLRCRDLILTVAETRVARVLRVEGGGA